MFVLFTSLKSGEDSSVWLVSAEAEAQEGWVFMPPDEFERLIEDAAERGAKRAMADVGLDGESAAADIRELRGLLEAFNTAKHTAWQTLVRMVTTGFILALVAGALIKLKFFGGH